MRLTRDEAAIRYGSIKSGIWINEKKWCVTYRVPEPLCDTWKHSIYLNIDIYAMTEQAINLVLARGLEGQLKSFNGCYNVRSVRGMPGKLSAHSYACAIDINASTNILGTDGDISQELADCFLESGFVWGKQFSRKDPMHFSSLGW